MWSQPTLQPCQAPWAVKCGLIPTFGASNASGVVHSHPTAWEGVCSASRRTQWSQAPSHSFFWGRRVRVRVAHSSLQVSCQLCCRCRISAARTLPPFLTLLPFSFPYAGSLAALLLGAESGWCRHKFLSHSLTFKSPTSSVPHLLTLLCSFPASCASWRRGRAARALPFHSLPFPLPHPLTSPLSLQVF